MWKNNIAKISLPTPFPVGDVNVYIIKGDTLTLIDTGLQTEQGKEALEQGLEDIGLSINDIEQIVLTHHHPDHAGGLGLFSENVPVYGHPNNQRFLHMTDEFMDEHEQFYLDFALKLGVPSEYKRMIAQIRRSAQFISQRMLRSALLEGDSIPGHSEWKVIETPGHAQSHISLYREKDGVMIGGDHLLEKISPNPLMEPPLQKGSERPKPLLQYNASLKKWLDIPISLLYTGHGNEVFDVPGLIKKQMGRQHGRAMSVKKMLEEKPSTGFEICRQLFPKVYQKELGLTLSETVGQLDYLANLGEIETRDNSGTIIYSVRQ
ncbi:MBL fold metallo-hydrolase [Peribacillus cavernae]|uniref:MBL fold metallo-hydrolase n=1 Tax=Peribacillus cavernae TaxID=1674310 RepID=A0A433HDZ8_9BACI|nr:MBL fold metallo-hydrolase [Peribacillus cavernae]MDQ0219077.1 glyoxylase-like metal-dependent hydrolase (beta-lactamase superfamily II) [Peribacillus cavernae]RUQ26528.1 MBL fold metallo-hydrolase [Peribacillus cavernae]